MIFLPLQHGNDMQTCISVKVLLEDMYIVLNIEPSSFEVLKYVSATLQFDLTSLLQSVEVVRDLKIKTFPGL